MAQSISYAAGRLFGRLPLIARAAVVLCVAGAVAYIATAPTSRTPTVAAPPAQPPKMTAAQEAKERDFRTVVAGARWLQNSMKNPKSFELVSAVMIDSKTICYEYRGTNSFNAVVPGRRVIGEAVNSDAAKDWNKHCAGKAGEDFTYARQAL